MPPLSSLASDDCERKVCKQLYEIGIRNCTDLLTKCHLFDVSVKAGVSQSVSTHVPLTSCVLFLFPDRFPFTGNQLLKKWKAEIKAQYTHKFIPLTEQMRLSTETLTYCPTGCQAVDRFLSGGLRGGDVTQITGAEGSGKTQLCYSVSVDQMLKGKRVLYIDTESAFSAERVTQMLRKRAGRCASLKSLMDQMHVVQVCEIHDLFSLLYKLLTDCEPGEQRLKYNVLILDSILSILSAYFTQLDRSGDHDEQFAVMKELIHCMNRLMHANPTLVLIVTNGKLQWYKRMWRNACALTLHISVDGRSGSSSSDSDDDISLDSMPEDVTVDESGAGDVAVVPSVRQLRVLRWNELTVDSDPRFQVLITDSGVTDYVAEQTMHPQ